MSLIECPDCLHQIAASAPGCPHCGHRFEPLPVPARAAYPSPPRIAIPQHAPAPVAPVQVVELTSKRFKAWQLLGLLMVFSGTPSCMLGAAMESNVIMLIGGLAFWSGLGIWIGARLLAWWNHG